MALDSIIQGYLARVRRRRATLPQCGSKEDGMNKPEPLTMERRAFLSRVVPACALGCTGVCIPPALAAVAKDPPPCQETHKFDQELPPFTLRQYFARQLASGIRVLKAIEAEIGEEELQRILLDHSYQRGAGQGEELAAENPEKDFFTYNERFRSRQMERIITYEIVEDTDEVFEIRVSECALVEPFQQAEAGHIGNAWLCNEDYGHAQGYNPNIQLVRDKTLMKGDAYCNHRYERSG